MARIVIEVTGEIELPDAIAKALREGNPEIEEQFLSQFRVALKMNATSIEVLSCDPDEPEPRRTFQDEIEGNWNPSHHREILEQLMRRYEEELMLRVRRGDYRDSPFQDATKRVQGFDFGRGRSFSVLFDEDPFAEKSRKR
jgi:hypothetical protein